MFWYERYLTSFYWAMTTMTTGNKIIFFRVNSTNSPLIVGYGDVIPKNAYECLVVACAMILMSCIFAYSISNIGLIIQEIEKDSNELNHSVLTIQK